jgi:hypothetical protein
MTSAARNTVLAAVIAMLAFAALVVMARSAHAAGRAEVQFVEPQKYADAGMNGIERERTLAILAEHVQQLAQRLPDGQLLRLQVLDVDLAGTLEWKRAQEVRVVRGAVDAPRLKFRWTLAQGESALRNGEEDLTDLGYTFGRPLAQASDGSLPYEKRLLNDWFKARFGTMAR